MPDSVMILDGSDPTAPPVTREATPEEQAAIDAQHAAAAADRAARHAEARFAGSEDAERLALVAERAAEDPAFAALAELTLKGA